MEMKMRWVLGVSIAACAAACSSADVGNEARAGAADVKPAAAPAADSDALPEGYVHVPNGVIAHRDCIHEIPNGAHVSVDGDVTLGGKLIAHHDACAHPIQFKKRVDDVVSAPGIGQAPLSNWIEAAWTNAPINEQFVYSDETFTVPQAPSTQKDTGKSSNGQIVYLFPSIQTSGMIVQPVLQWGSWGPGTAGTGYNGSGAQIGSSSSWTYAAWGVTNTSVYHSTGITVQPGDLLEGTMQAWSQTTNFISWEIVALDKTTGASTFEIVDFATNGLWNNAQAGVLEAYNINACSDFPSTGGTDFNYPTLQEATYGSPWSGKETQVNPSSSIWTALSYTSGLVSGYAGPACGFQTIIGSTTAGTTLEY